MNILLIDDDLVFLNSFKNQVIAYAKTIFDNICVETCTDTSCLNEKMYSLYFLDIDLPHHDGITLAKEIKTYNRNAKIIFVTSQNDLVYNAITIQPFYFIRKNNLEHDLSIAFLLLKDYYVQKDFYTFKYDSDEIKILVENIQYIETTDHLSTIHTDHKQYHLYKSLKNLMQEINSPLFVQTSRNKCVNIMHVIERKKNIIFLDNNVEVKLGTPYKLSFEKKFFSYMNKGEISYDI